MHAEITEQINGWVFYDGECPLCRKFAAHFQPRLARNHMGTAPLQTQWVREKLGLSEGEELSEMKVLTPHGEILGGAAAMVYLARLVWWGWPLRALWRLPGGKILLRKFYAGIAARRHWLAGGKQS